jgi:hypothetical protein
LTTVDGTLSAGSTGTAKFTGGSLYGAGAIKANTTVGNATGTAVTINVGDSGTSGLLAITGTYTQLATATMNVSIGGLTTGTYSELTASGATSLGGTLTVAIVNGLVLTSGDIGDTFTILSSTGTLSGSFTNSTVTSGTDVFTVSYVGKNVVLTLSSVTGAAVKSGSPAAQTAIAAKQTATGTVAKSQGPATSGLRSGKNNVAKPILVAAWSGAHSNAVPVRGSELNNLRGWEPAPIISTNVARPVAVERISTADQLHNGSLPTSDLRMRQNQAVGVRAPLAGWLGNSSTRREPVKILSPMLPRIAR